MEKCSIKSSFSPYHYKKMYVRAKIGNEVLEILKKRNVSDCRTKSGSRRNGRLLASLPKDIL